MNKNYEQNLTTFLESCTVAWGTSIRSL